MVRGGFQVAFIAAEQKHKATQLRFHAAFELFAICFVFCMCGVVFCLLRVS
jgi:hypothetical protein